MKGPLASPGIMTQGKKICLIVLVIFAFLRIGRSENMDVLTIGDFSQGNLSGWTVKKFAGQTTYEFVNIGSEQVLKADSRSSASGLVKKIGVDLHEYPYLNWRWRIENRLEHLDEKQKSGDDYSARIYCIVSGGLFSWRTKSINYVWSSRSRTGDVWPNAFAGKNVIMVAVRSADDRLSTWYQEKRNVLDDFVQIYGQQFDHIDAVAIMTDTDNSRGEAVTYYGDIFFSKE